MATSITLPLSEPVNKEYFEIRLESIGGLGANLCGKMLGELGALYLNLNSSSFSSYGSEKRGSSVKSYIRWCSSEKELRINSPVVNPDMLVIFHEALIGNYPVFSGITPSTRIILNTSLTPTEASDKYQITMGTLFCIDALSVAMELASRINMVLLGALVKASAFIPLTECKILCADTIGQKYPSQITANLDGLQQGYERVSPGLSLMDSMQTNCNVASDSLDKANDYVWGYQNAPIGGVNTRPGSTVSNDLSSSREGYIPLFLQDRCINCGLCESTCPDFVFQFHPGVYKGNEMMVNGGLDYYHCKGCLRCVAICPTQALVRGLEAEHPEKSWFVPNQDLQSNRIDYENNGVHPWITSDSYLTEKRIDGGLV